MDEVRQIWGGEVVYGIECIEEDLVFNTVFDREPMKLVQDGGDVTYGRGFGDDACSSVLDQLEFMEEFVGETKQKGVAIIQT